MTPTRTRKTAKQVEEFFLASLVVRIPGKRGRHAWRGELLRAESPRRLLRMVDGRKHVAYASNGIDVVRIELIDVGSTILAPIADGAQAEPLCDLLDRLSACPSGLVW
jgi:hypothetical protein